MVASRTYIYNDYQSRKEASYFLSTDHISVIAVLPLNKVYTFIAKSLPPSICSLVQSMWLPLHGFQIRLGCWVAKMEPYFLKNSAVQYQIYSLFSFFFFSASIF